MVTKTYNTRKGLSNKESILLSKLSSKKIISIEDIKSELNTTYNNAKKIASKLNKKGWLDRIDRGKYLIIPLEAGTESIYTEHEFVIASNLISNYYIAFLSALNFHGMTEQTPFTVFVAATERKKNRTIHDIPYNFIKIDKKKFFGYEKYAVASSQINISVPEKTIIDSLDHLEYSGGIIEVVKGLNEKRDELNIDKMVNYAVKINNGAVVKRLHFLMDFLNFDIPNDVENKLINNYSDSYSLLDNTLSDKGKYRSKWKLRINIKTQDLLEEGY